jgi:hypothetical protein
MSLDSPVVRFLLALAVVAAGGCATVIVTLKLHETKGGSLLGTDTVEGASQVDLLRSLRERGRQLLTSAFGPRRAAR